MGPEDLESQFAVAVELDELARAGGDRELRSDAVWVRYIASMTRGDVGRPVGSTLFSSNLRLSSSRVAALVRQTHRHRPRAP
jgi:hypothetical protein